MLFIFYLYIYFYSYHTNTTYGLWTRLSFGIKITKYEKIIKCIPTSSSLLLKYYIQLLHSKQIKYQLPT